MNVRVVPNCVPFNRISGIMSALTSGAAKATDRKIDGYMLMGSLNGRARSPGKF